MVATTITSEAHGSPRMPKPQWLRQTGLWRFFKNPSQPQNSLKHLRLSSLRSTLDWQWPCAVLKSLRNCKWLIKFTVEFWVLPFDLMYCPELKNSLISEQRICSWHSWGQWPWWPLEYIPGTFASENILCLVFKCFLLKWPPGLSHPVRGNTAMLSLAVASNVLPVSGVKRDFPPEMLSWPLSTWNSQSECARSDGAKACRQAGRGAREGPQIKCAVLCHSRLQTLTFMSAMDLLLRVQHFLTQQWISGRA